MTENRKIQLVWHPQFIQLKEEVAKLQVEFSMLLLERDHLLLMESKNLEMAYLLAFGGQEYKIYDLQVGISRLKRKVALLQAKINRQEKVNLVDIEEILDKEFHQYQEELSQKMAAMDKALERRDLAVLSVEESKELKNLYRKIVKACHPDLHPEEPPEKLALFQEAVTAYENGDLAKLRFLEAASFHFEIEENLDKSPFLQLTEEKERLKKIIHICQEKIIKINNSFPFTKKNC